MKFVDLNAQFKVIEKQVRRSIDEVLRHGQFIMGPEVRQLERELAEFCGVKHVISAASGTDALLMALMAYGVRPGDAVIAPPFTFVATAEVVQLLGATTVFVDVEENTFNLDIHRLEKTIERVKSEGKLNLRGVIPVDLFGLPADYDAIENIASQHGLFVLSDAAQSFGAEYHGQRAGKLGDIAATSFFPAKTLGCYGDGGAVFTDNDELADIVESIRFHGKGKTQYDNIRTGITGRLDTIQAAILSCKLSVFDAEMRARQSIADTYTRELSGCVMTPQVPPGYQSAWAQYTIRSDKRDRIREHLTQRGIPSAVYYPCPLHRQPAFWDADGAGIEMPVSEKLSKEVLSLPVQPYLTRDDQMRVVEAVKEATAS